MNTRPIPHGPGASRERGLSLIEMLIATVIMGGVILIVTTILISSGRLHTKTMRRVETSADARQALNLMSGEIRQAGADPSNPPVGILAIVSADSVQIRVRSDLNGNGTIQTAEPSEDVTYRYDPAAKTILRDPGAGASVLLSGVSAMRLSYFDATNQPLTALPLSASDAALVHSVGLAITAVDKDSLPLNLVTRITLRNL